LPEESIANLHDHSNELFNHSVLLRSRQFDVLYSNFKFRKVLLNNEISIFFRDDQIGKLANRKFGNEPGKNDGEGS